MISNTSEIQRVVAMSNQLAEYPPVRLTKMEFQALLVLISYIDSTERPIYGMDDVKEKMFSRGVVQKEEQMKYLEEMITQQNTFRVPFKEYVRYFADGVSPKGGIIKRALKAALSLNTKKIEFNTPRIEGAFQWFQAVYTDKQTNELVFVITSFIKPFLMGLRRDFLQMLAESTMEFDGKHSIPIYLFMKSKLYEGTEEYHGREMMDAFRYRFGLDKIKTYDDFGQLRRRVLDKAEADSKKSGDIYFTFEGKATQGGKKITEIHYHVYRIANIRDKRNNNKVNRGGVLQGLSKEQQNRLNKSQLLAFKFLFSKGINQNFILDRILTHPKLKYEQIKGFEDVYVKQLWTFFEKKTRAKKKAGAFVSWWKRGRLTDDNLHTRLLEQIAKYRKQLITTNPERMANRQQAMKTTALQFDQWTGKQTKARDAVEPSLANNKKTKTNLGSKSTPKPQPKYKTTRGRYGKPVSLENVIRTIALKTPIFDFDEFKIKHPEEHRRIAATVKIDFIKALKLIGEEFDEAKFSQSIKNQTQHLCKEWHLKQQKTQL